VNGQKICRWVEELIGRKLDASTLRPVSGGCINKVWMLGGQDPVFLKMNRPERIAMFESEMLGLKLLRATGVIRVPRPYGVGQVDGCSMLVMEGIELRTQAGPSGQSTLGKKLANLHGTGSPNGKFGAAFDNYIGATEQANSWNDSWADFFVENRLRFQMQLAAQNGRPFSQAERLLDRVHQMLSIHQPVPSLLHGDLWSGNVGFDEQGSPVIFDPATYYGDAECDMAFTSVFGGFTDDFYRAYREIRHSPENEEILHQIYNLYHILNHWNLFGGGYGEQAGQMMDRILDVPVSPE